jgi:uncharacterized protein YbjT (DUF2867 family)
MDRLVPEALPGRMTILILGGTGKTGRRVARRLRAAGHPVRTAARSGADVPFDLADPATWTPALAGVTAAYVVEPELGTDPARVPRFVADAVAAGVRRLVMLSAPGVDDVDGHPLQPAERAVRGSGVGWTVLRPSWFAQNFGEAMWRPGILAGTLALPTGEGRTPFVDAEDIAEVAASALTGDRHDGEVYELSGPRAIGFGEAVALIARATGRTIRHDDVDPEVFVEHQVAAGVPLGIARVFAGLYLAIRAGQGAALFDGVPRALGREPRAFEDYVAEAAAAGCWA